MVFFDLQSVIRITHADIPMSSGAKITSALMIPEIFFCLTIGFRLRPVEMNRFKPSCTPIYVNANAVFIPSEDLEFLPFFDLRIYVVGITHYCASEW